MLPPKLTEKKEINIVQISKKKKFIRMINDFSNLQEIDKVIWTSKI